MIHNNEDHQQTVEQQKPKCKLCSKPLVKLFSSRVNGVTITIKDDWPTRQLHKKCWKQLKFEK
jgi:hypothetical protein